MKNIYRSSVENDYQPVLTHVVIRYDDVKFFRIILSPGGRGKIKTQRKCLNLIV